MATQLSAAEQEQVQDWEKAVGALVRDKRRALGLSQERLAELAHCDRQSINRLENAAFTPSIERLFWLAHALQCQPADLLAPIDLPAAAPRALPGRRASSKTQRDRRTA